jgi:hypothetical protein
MLTHICTYIDTSTYTYIDLQVYIFAYLHSVHQQRDDDGLVVLGYLLGEGSPVGAAAHHCLDVRCDPETSVLVERLHTHKST